nr:COPII coat assembly protein SEC16-like [Aegilops tauschii subsp. strangulata]
MVSIFRFWPSFPLPSRLLTRHRAASPLPPPVHSATPPQLSPQAARVIPHAAPIARCTLPTRAPPRRSSRVLPHPPGVTRCRHQRLPRSTHKGEGAAQPAWRRSPPPAAAAGPGRRRGAPHYQQALPAGHEAFIGAPFQPIVAGYGALLVPLPLGGYGPPVPAPPYGGLPPPPVPAPRDPTLLAAQHSAPSPSSSVGGGDWYMDSGATAHMAAHPDLVTNLVSVRLLTRENPLTVEFDGVGFSVKDARTQMDLHRCDSPDELYTVHAGASTSTPVALAAGVDLWHARLGHPNHTVPTALAPSAPAPAPPSWSDAWRQPPAPPPARCPIPPPPGFVTPSPEVESERAPGSPSPSYEVEPGTPPAHPATGSTSSSPVASSAAGSADAAAAAAPAAAAAAPPAAPGAPAAATPAGPAAPPLGLTLLGKGL